MKETGKSIIIITVSLGLGCVGHCTSLLQDPAPAQTICSDTVQEGKEETGKLRQRIVSKEFMVQQIFSILTAHGSWQGVWVSQPVGAALQQCKRHRASAAWCGAVLGGVCFWQGYKPAQMMQLQSSRPFLDRFMCHVPPGLAPLALSCFHPLCLRAGQGEGVCSFQQDVHPLEGL